MSVTRLLAYGPLRVVLEQCHGTAYCTAWLPGSPAPQQGQGATFDEAAGEAAFMVELHELDRESNIVTNRDVPVTTPAPAGVDLQGPAIAGLHLLTE